MERVMTFAVFLKFSKTTTELPAKAYIQHHKCSRRPPDPETQPDQLRPAHRFHGPVQRYLPRMGLARPYSAGGVGWAGDRRANY